MLFISLLINALATYLTFKFKSLTKYGAMAAFLVGFLFMYLGGFASWILLIMLLVSSTVIEKGSLLMKLKSPNQRSSPTSEHSGRSAYQVLANSLLALLCLLVYSNSPNPVYYYLLVIAIAGSTADTWASEIGILSDKKPRSFLTGKQMPTGKSGGVTPLGLFASLLGSAFIVTIAVVCTVEVTLNMWLPLMILGGLCSLIDSFLGLTVQVVYLDLKTNKETEAIPDSTTASQFKRIKGLPGFDNSVVNIVSDLLTLLISWLYLTKF